MINSNSEKNPVTWKKNQNETTDARVLLSLMMHQKFGILPLQNN